MADRATGRPGPGRGRSLHRSDGRDRAVVRRVGAGARPGRAGRPSRRAPGGPGARPLARVGRRADARRRLGDRARFLRGVRTRDGVTVRRSRRAARAAAGARWRPRLSLAAFTLQGITIPRGRDRLGLSVRLRGTGMAIRREVALAHRFRAPASEDLFFTLDLLLEGVRCRHVDVARLRSQGASTWGAFGGQKVRYEAGRIAAARAYVPRLLRRAHQTTRCGLPGGRVVPGLAAVRGRRALARCWPSAWRRSPAPGRSPRCSRAAFCAARPRPPHRPDPGSRRAAHLAGPVPRAVVSGVEGRGPAARRRERPAPRRLLRTDRSRLKCPGQRRDRRGRRPALVVAAAAVGCGTPMRTPPAGHSHARAVRPGPCTSMRPRPRWARRSGGRSQVQTVCLATGSYGNWTGTGKAIAIAAARARRRR